MFIVWWVIDFQMVLHGTQRVCIIVLSGPINVFTVEIGFGPWDVYDSLGETTPVCDGAFVHVSDMYLLQKFVDVLDCEFAKPSCSPESRREACPHCSIWSISGMSVWSQNMWNAARPDP